MKNILKNILRALRKITPSFILRIYHFLWAVASIIIYRHPSRHLIVIGVTGTKGKTSTSILIHDALSAAGLKVGLLSTAEIRFGKDVEPNLFHMTMKGRGFSQKMLRKMVDVGCTHAVVETPSEGILQFRSYGIQYDSVVFTNLSPEHLVTHKTFENYRNTKGRLFSNHAHAKQKHINGNPVPRFVLLNADDEHLAYFQSLTNKETSEVILYGTSEKAQARAQITRADTCTGFTYNNTEYHLPFTGSFFAYNALPAVILAEKYANADSKKVAHALSSSYLPGRMEHIDEGQSYVVIVDYAHEPLSITSACNAAATLKKEHSTLIAIVGAAGGGRWRLNAEDIGKKAALCADHIIVTDVDPFQDNPREIANAVVKGIQTVKKREHYEVILDRRKAIHKACQLAKKDDVVLITGKGAEQTMEVATGSMHWDERQIIRETLQDIKNN